MNHPGNAYFRNLPVGFLPSSWVNSTLSCAFPRWFIFMFYPQFLRKKYRQLYKAIRMSIFCMWASAHNEKDIQNGTH